MDASMIPLAPWCYLSSHALRMMRAALSVHSAAWFLARRVDMAPIPVPKSHDWCHISSTPTKLRV